MITIICDVCGKKVEEPEFVEDFHICANCWKEMKPKFAAWKEAKAKLFKEFFVSKPAKPCACKCGEKCACKPAAVKTTCKGNCHEHKMLTKLLTTAELAKELGQKVSTIQCYAHRHGIGISDPKRRIRLYNAEDAADIRKHFKGGK